MRDVSSSDIIQLLRNEIRLFNDEATIYDENASSKKRWEALRRSLLRFYEGAISKETFVRLAIDSWEMSKGSFWILTPEMINSTPGLKERYKQLATYIYESSANGSIYSTHQDVISRCLATIDWQMRANPPVNYSILED